MAILVNAAGDMEEQLLAQIALLAPVCDRLSEVMLSVTYLPGCQAEWLGSAQAAQRAAVRLKSELIRCYLQLRIDAGNAEMANSNAANN
jgi:hypothetical protein